MFWRYSDMRNTFVAVVACLAALCCIASAAETNTGTWMIQEYLDEFRLPTGRRYITNALPIGGTYTHGRGDL